MPIPENEVQYVTMPSRYYEFERILNAFEMACTKRDQWECNHPGINLDESEEYDALDLSAVNLRHELLNFIK